MLGLMTAFAATALLARGTAVPQSPQPNLAVSEALGAVLGGDGQGALRLMSDLPTAGLNERDERFRRCAPDRLRSVQPVTSTDVADPFVREVLGAYRSYWHSSVMMPDRREDAEQRLLAELRTLLGLPNLMDFGSAEPLVLERIRSAGLYSLGGKTGPLRELMIWSEQTERAYDVALPEGGQRTRVVLLDRFLSRGWGSYLTCDRSGTGGWAKRDGLYAVVPSYDSLEDENFRINFLAHESQHFADYVRFPDLKGWELEYRAKLVELAQAVTTRDRIIARFENQQSDDETSPHAYANKRVLTVLRERLGLPAGGSFSTVSITRLHEAALAELLNDTASRAAHETDPR